MPCHERLDSGPVSRVDITAGGQVFSEWLLFVARPCLKRGNKLRLVDQPDLKCDQSEKEVAISGFSHGAAPNFDIRSATVTPP
jgi:hypothetical protein